MTTKPRYAELINKVHELQKAPHDSIGYSLTDVFGRQNRAIKKPEMENRI